MLASAAVAQQIERHGFAILDTVITESRIGELISALEWMDETESMRKRDGVFAVRNLLDVSEEIRTLARSESLQELIRPILGERFYPVRGILFDKIPDANWKVPWHQDLTIAVRERLEVDGFGPWSVKAGVLHVQPPASVLERMLTMRLHLDDCNARNGALRVIAGSHLVGRIAEREIAAVRACGREAVCEVARGGVLLMRPLLLHASSPSAVPTHRRVIHIDYAAVDLPAGLRWLTNSHDEAGVTESISSSQLSARNTHAAPPRPRPCDLP